MYIHTQKTHILPLPGGPISQGKGCVVQRMQPTQTQRLNPLVHTVTYITVMQADPLNCNMPICSALKMGNRVVGDEKNVGGRKKKTVKGGNGGKV